MIRFLEVTMVMCMKYWLAGFQLLLLIFFYWPSVEKIFCAPLRNTIASWRGSSRSGVYQHKYYRSKYFISISAYPELLHGSVSCDCWWRLCLGDLNIPAGSRTSSLSLKESVLPSCCERKWCGSRMKIHDYLTLLSVLSKFKWSACYADAWFV